MNRLNNRLEKVEAHQGDKRPVFIVSYAPSKEQQRPRADILEEYFDDHPEQRGATDILIIYSAIPPRAEGDPGKTY